MVNASLAPFLQYRLQREKTCHRLALGVSRQEAVKDGHALRSEMLGGCHPPLEGWEINPMQSGVVDERVEHGLVRLDAHVAVLR